MSTNKLKDDRLLTYVGLNDIGEIVQHFSGPDEFENREPNVASIGFVEAIPVDYEEIYSVHDVTAFDSQPGEPA